MIPKRFVLASDIVEPSGLPVPDIIVKSLRNDSKLAKRSFAHLLYVHKVVKRREVVVKSANYFARFLIGRMFMSGTDNTNVIGKTMSGIYINVRLGVEP